MSNKLHKIIKYLFKPTNSHKLIAKELQEGDIIEVFNKINKYFNNNFQPEFKESIVGEQKRSCLSFDKIKSFLNWSPRIGFDEGLDRTYCYFLREKMKKKKN